MNLTPIARKLRKSSTPHERILWKHLRNANLDGIKFRRQQPIDHYIVDFVSFEIRLIIELDGSQHFENESDKIRDEYLTQNKFRILRFWNNEITENLDNVLQKIWSECEKLKSPSP